MAMTGERRPYLYLPPATVQAFSFVTQWTLSRIFSISLSCSSIIFNAWCWGWLTLSCDDTACDQEGARHRRKPNLEDSKLNLWE